MGGNVGGGPNPIVSSAPGVYSMIAWQDRLTGSGSRPACVDILSSRIPHNNPGYTFEHKYLYPVE